MVDPNTMTAQAGQVVPVPTGSIVLPAPPEPTGVPIEMLVHLKMPTDPKDAKTRPGPYGVVLTYVDARYVMDILDGICGPQNWQDAYQPLGDVMSSKGVRAGIGILVRWPDGHTEWVWKWDVGGESDIEDIKGAHSEAFKRAAVKWGIARDLYDENSPARIAASRSAPTRPPVSAAVQPQPQPVGMAPQPVAAPAPVPAPGTPSVQVMPWVGSLPWVCPVHGEVKAVLGTKYNGGKQSRAGKDYTGFLGCTDRTCSNTGPRLSDEQVAAVAMGIQQGTAYKPGFTTLAPEAPAAPTEGWQALIPDDAPLPFNS